MNVSEINLSLNHYGHKVERIWKAGSGENMRKLLKTMLKLLLLKCNPSGSNGPLNSKALCPPSIAGVRLFMEAKFNQVHKMFFH